MDLPRIFKHLFVLGLCLENNSVYIWQCLCLIWLYILHWFEILYSKYYLQVPEIYN